MRITSCRKCCKRQASSQKQARRSTRHFQKIWDSVSPLRLRIAMRLRQACWTALRLHQSQSIRWFQSRAGRRSCAPKTDHSTPLFKRQNVQSIYYAKAKQSSASHQDQLAAKCSHNEVKMQKLSVKQRSPSVKRPTYTTGKGNNRNLTRLCERISTCPLSCRNLYALLACMSDHCITVLRFSSNISKRVVS